MRRVNAKAACSVLVRRRAALLKFLIRIQAEEKRLIKRLAGAHDPTRSVRHGVRGLRV
jgi:hypothetical protein